jgi:hypothetical protein
MCVLRMGWLNKRQHRTDHQHPKCHGKITLYTEMYIVGYQMDLRGSDFNKGVQLNKIYDCTHEKF